MKLIEYIKTRYKNQSKWANFSDIFFGIIVVGMLIPSTRTEILGLGGRLRTIIWPVTIELENPIQLNNEDYNFSITNLKGDVVDFSGLKGKVIFLNVWATWCPPCVGEMPDIEKLYKKFENNENVEFVILTNQEISEISLFISKREFTMPVYMLTAQMPQVFATPSIPTTFIISKSGKIIVNQKGAANWSGSKVTSLLEQLSNE